MQSLLSLGTAAAFAVHLCGSTGQMTPLAQHVTHYQESAKIYMETVQDEARALADKTNVEMEKKREGYDWKTW